MLNNKVILQIVPALNNGGVERGVIETSKFLVKNNNKSIVISSGGIYAVSYTHLRAHETQ